VNPAGPIVGLSNDLMAGVANQAGNGFTDFPDVIDQHHA
jgi:hypothetical protein